MRPYPGLNAEEEELLYNYIHSTGHRVYLKYAFGILTSRWRIFKKPIRATISSVKKYTMGCLERHKYLRQMVNTFYSPSGYIDS